jgi:hypothetical protein
MDVDIRKCNGFFGCLILCVSIIPVGLKAYTNLESTHSRKSNTHSSLMNSSSEFFISQNYVLTYKDTSTIPRPEFSRQGAIQGKSSIYWDSTFERAYKNAWKYTDTNGNLALIPWEIRSRFQLKFETGSVPNSLFERFLGGNDLSFYAVKITRNNSNADSLRSSPDGISSMNLSPKLHGQEFGINSADSISKLSQASTLQDSSGIPKINSLKIENKISSDLNLKSEIEITKINSLKSESGISPKTEGEIAIKTSPKTTNPLRVLVKFDWMGVDTLRNVLLLSNENDDQLDLNTVLNYWVAIPELKNVQVNRNDTFLPKRVKNSGVEELGYDVFLPEFYITPLTCFHAPILVEFWGKSSVTVYKDMEKIDGLTLDEVIPILKSVKSHTELYHSELCKQDMMKVQLYIKNKSALVSDFINFVQGISELNYLLEVKSN